MRERGSLDSATRLPRERQARLLGVLVALGVGGVLASSCGAPGKQNPAAPSGSGRGVVPVIVPAPLLVAQVTISDFQFHPATLSVPVGATVEWTNRDPHQHTVTLDVPDGWGSPLLDPHDSYEHTFRTPGTYAYDCVLHSVMKGVVIVTAAR